MAKAKITESKIIKNRIVKSELADWHEFKFLQPQNFKDISMEAHNKLKASIRNNQFVEPFKAWQNGKDTYCLDGFHRCKVMAELESEGFKISDKMPTDFLECKNKKEASKLVLIYSSIYARMSDEGLYEFLDSYKLDFDDLKLEIDLPDFDLDKFEQGYIRDASEEIEDEVPEVPKKAKSKLGDLYLLGGTHRLLCGDCTDKDMVDRLMDGKKADMVFTDPPYNMAKGFNNDDLEHSDFEAFIKKAFKLLSNSLNVGSIITIWTSPRQIPFIINNIIPSGYNWLRYLHLYKPNDETFPWHGWILTSESILLFSYGEIKNKFYDDLKPYADDCYIHNHDITASDFIRGKHPTIKPLKVIVDIIKRIKGEIVFDGFLGSGSTLIACEKTNRICYGLEIEPLYIDVILERYKNLTGKKVKLIKRLDS